MGTCLAKQNGIYHVSVGDVLRDRRAKGYYDDRDNVLQSLNQGELLETEVIVSLIIDISKEYELKGARTLFIDGFPRRLDQALEFELRVRIREVFMDQGTMLMMGPVSKVRSSHLSYLPD